MASGKTLYIKGDRDVEVTKPDVTLADLLSMECSDQSLLPKLKTMKILKFKKTGNQRCVISVLKIIACIHGQYPDMEVQNLGETDMIVTYEDQKTPSYAWHLTKTANFKTSRRMDILYQALWRSEISEQRPPGNGIF